MDNHTIPKESIVEKLSEKYNPKSIGEIEKYPPMGNNYVTLYFSDSFTVSNRYNIKIKQNHYHFEISNISHTNDESMVTIRITKD